MYNEGVKRQFINSTYRNEQVRTDVSRLLDRIGVFEAEVSKDLCNFNLDEVSSVVDGVCGVMPRSIIRNKGVIAAYLEYTGSKVTRRSVMSINLDRTDRIQNQMVRDVTDLQELLDCLLPTDRVFTRNSLYRAFLWLAFSGIDVEDVTTVRMRDLNFSNNTICFGGDVYTIYKESVNDLYAACRSSEVYKPLTNGRYSKISRVSGDCVVREVGELGSTYPRLRASLSREVSFKQEETGLSRRISYKKAYLSGVFSRAQEQTELSLEEYFTNIRRAEIRRKDLRIIMNGKEPGKIDNHKFRADVRVYIESYQDWKKAFYQSSEDDE